LRSLSQNCGFPFSSMGFGLLRFVSRYYAALCFAISSRIAGTISVGTSMTV
jgi:hypothetical protein